MDIWNGLKQVVAKGAPVLANAIVPGSGGLAGSLIGKVLGVDPNDPQEMMRAVQQASPEQWAKLQEAEMEHRAELARVSADLDKAYLQDRQDSRRRDVELRKSGHNNWRADVLAIVAIAGLIGLIFTVIAVKIEQGPARDLLLLLAGSLVAIVKDVYQFEFGSSRGSKEKDVSKQLERQP